ncbi:MAG: hypothetical protein OZX49_00596 [Immundisolibacter sp.]|nr:hypothetical protein [Immundisolibacter sp.]
MQGEVLRHRQFVVERERLRHVADAPARGDVVRVDLVSEQPGLAFGRRQQAGEHLHGRGLAAAVGAQKTEDLTPRHAQADVIDRREVAKAHGQIPGLDCGIAIVLRPRRNLDRPVTPPLVLRQQADEGLFQRRRAGLRQDGRWAADGQYPAIVHGRQPVEARCLFHVGSGHQHAQVGAVAADAGDQVPELAPRQRIDAGGGLVQDQQVRVVDQRAAQAELLLHAAGQLAGRPVQKWEQPGGARERLDPPCPLAAVVAEQAGEELEVLGDRQRRVEVLAQALRHVGNARQDAPARAGIGQVHAEHLDPAVLDGARAGGQRQQARLADPVRADQAGHATARQVERHIDQRLDLAVAQANAAEAGHRGAVRRRAGGGRGGHGGRMIASCSGQAALRSMRT